MLRHVLSEVRDSLRQTLEEQVELDFNRKESSSFYSFMREYSRDSSFERSQAGRHGVYSSSFKDTEGSYIHPDALLIGCHIYGNVHIGAGCILISVEIISKGDRPVRIEDNSYLVNVAINTGEGKLIIGKNASLFNSEIRLSSPGYTGGHEKIEGDSFMLYGHLNTLSPNGKTVTIGEGMYIVGSSIQLTPAATARLSVGSNFTAYSGIADHRTLMRMAGERNSPVAYRRHLCGLPQHSSITRGGVMITAVNIEIGDDVTFLCNDSLRLNAEKPDSTVKFDNGSSLQATACMTDTKFLVGLRYLRVHNLEIGPRACLVLRTLPGKDSSQNEACEQKSILVKAGGALLIDLNSSAVFKDGLYFSDTRQVQASMTLVADVEVGRDGSGAIES